MASAEREPIRGLGACPQWGPGSGGQGGEAPPEADEVFATEIVILGQL